jgi:tetratricopeptide (TPR) repeat protein
MLLLLFSSISALTVRPQAKNKAKTQRESFISDKEQIRNVEFEKEPPGDGEEWFNRGYQMHSSDRYEEAIKSFMYAVALDYRMATAMYNIACGYSLLNDKENALIWLQRSLESGFDRNDLVAEDSDLDPLRGDPRFQKILAMFPADNDRGHWRDVRRYTNRDRLERIHLNFANLERDASKSGEDWAKVGVDLLRLRELDRGVVALNRAVNYLDSKGSTAMYNLACAYALQGNRDAGIQWLENSVNAGFDSPEKLRNDPDIDNLRTDSRFPAINKLSNTLSLSQFKRDTFRGSDKDNYSKQRWAPAIALYESFLKREPNNGRAWFNLGYALHFSREHSRAAAAFKRAAELGFNKPNSTYNIACAYAMLNQTDLAFEWLDRAVKAGFDSNGVGWDHDLDNLRSDARFKRFVESANYNTKVRSKK